MKMRASTKEYYKDTGYAEAWEHICAAFEVLGFKDMYYALQKFYELEGQATTYHLVEPTKEQRIILGIAKDNYLKKINAENKITQMLWWLEFLSSGNASRIHEDSQLKKSLDEFIQRVKDTNGANN